MRTGDAVRDGSHSIGNAGAVHWLRDFTGSQPKLILTPELASAWLDEFDRAYRRRLREVPAHDHAAFAKAGATYCPYCVLRLAPR